MDYKELVERAKEIDEKATPGPWMWDLRECVHQCLLTTTHSGKYYVMSFQRWGMQDALPSFQVYDRYEGPVKERGSHGMVRADELSKSYPGQEHHRGFDNFIDHPDARYIAESRQLFHLMTEAITDLLARAESEKVRCKMAEKCFDNSALHACETQLELEKKARAEAEARAEKAEAELAAIKAALGDDYDLDRLSVLVSQRMTMREDVAARMKLVGSIPLDRLSALAEAERDGRISIWAPDEQRDMRKAVKVAVRDLIQIGESLVDVPVERIKELVEADREGRCAVLSEPMKPMMYKSNDTDVYCPTCGHTLSGGWPLSDADDYRKMCQCQNCGQSIDDTKCESAEPTLKGQKNV